MDDFLKDGKEGGIESAPLILANIPEKQIGFHIGLIRRNFLSMASATAMMRIPGNVSTRETIGKATSIKGLVVAPDKETGRPQNYYGIQRRLARTG